MKFKSLKLILFLFVMVSVFVACEDEDDPIQNEFIEEDRTEQQAKDKDSLLNYLNSHYYNSEFFETGTNHTIEEIVITELLEDEDVPAGHKLLIEDVIIKTTTYVDVEYEYYYLTLNQGGGDSP